MSLGHPVQPTGTVSCSPSWHLTTHVVVCVISIRTIQISNGCGSRNLGYAVRFKPSKALLSSLYVVQHQCIGSVRYQLCLPLPPTPIQNIPNGSGRFGKLVLWVRGEQLLICSILATPMVANSLMKLETWPTTWKYIQEKNHLHAANVTTVYNSRNFELLYENKHWRKAIYMRRV